MSRLYSNFDEKRYGNESSRENTEFHCDESRWAALLDLGFYYGWRPEGTLWEDGSRKHNYRTNDGQFVTSSDAIALAYALENAVRKLGPYLTEEVNVAWHMGIQEPVLVTEDYIFLTEDDLIDTDKLVGQVGQLPSVSADSADSLVATILKLSKSYIKSFIDFCCVAGGFDIC